ncbi:MAG: metal-dependent hydrolase [Candidatus Bathyarchaeia archaeon]
MFAVGHIAMGYLIGQAFGRRLKVQINMPLLLAASVIPDIDLFLRFLLHRGPTHSLITIIAFTVPFLMLYGKIAVPYSVALASHSLIGDYFTGGTQLFWPFSAEWYGALNISVNSPANALLELTFFFASIAVMFRKGDLRKIAKDKYKMALLLPFLALIWPILVMGRGSEYTLPPLLVIPSLFYLAIFSSSILFGKLEK